MSRAGRYLRVSASARHAGWGADGDRVGGSWRWGWNGGRGLVEHVPDAAREMAFEAADRFPLGFAFAVSSIEVCTGRGVCPGAGEGDDVDRAVELAVAAAVQPVAFGVPRAGGDRGGACVASEARVGRESLGAGGVADEDRGGDRAAAVLGE